MDLYFIQWALPDPDRGVRKTALDDAFRHGSAHELRDELTLSPSTGPVLQFEFMFDFSCSTIFSSSLSKAIDLCSLPSLVIDA